MEEWRYLYEYDTLKYESMPLPKNMAVALLVEYDSRKWTMEKVNGMYSTINYKSKLPAKRGKKKLRLLLGIIH